MTEYMLSTASAAVAALLSPDNSEPSTRSVKISKSKIKEVSQQSILDRSDISQLARFLNTTPHLLKGSLDVSYEQNRSTRQTIVQVIDSSICDESRHIVAPSSNSSADISIIEAGSIQNSSKSLTSHNSLSNQSSVSTTTNSTSMVIGQMPESHSSSKNSCRSSEQSGNRVSRSSSRSSVHSVHVGDINEVPVRDLTPTQADHMGKGVEDNNGSVNSKASVQSFPENNPEYCSTPVPSGSGEKSTTPPALLNPDNKDRKRLKQGSDVNSKVIADKSAEKKADILIIQSSSQQTQARASLKQALGTRGKPPKNVIVHTQSNVQCNNPPVNVPTPDMTTLITAAVAATAPINQLRTDFEKRLEELGNKLKEYESRERPAKEKNDIQEPVHDPIPFNMTLATPLPRPPPQPTRVADEIIAVPALALTHQKIEKKAKKKSHNLREEFVAVSSTELQRDEFDEIKENILELLQDARMAKDDIEEIRREERVAVMKNRINSESPIDIFLEKIKQRNEGIKVPKTPHVPSIPAYVLRARNILSEVQEERRRYEDKNDRYQLDVTYLCNESDDDDPVKKQITNVISDIKEEVRAELTAPQKKGTVKRTTKSLELKSGRERQPIKRRSLPTRERLEHTKKSYEQIVAANQYQKLLADIGELKLQEREMKEALRLGAKQEKQVPQLKKSPYERKGFPQSTPISIPLHSPEHRREPSFRDEKVVKENIFSTEKIRQSEGRLCVSNTNLHHDNLPLSESKGLRFSSVIPTRSVCRDDVSYAIPCSTSKLPHSTSHSTTQLPYDTTRTKSCPTSPENVHIEPAASPPSHLAHYTTPGTSHSSPDLSNSTPGPSHSIPEPSHSTPGSSNSTPRSTHLTCQPRIHAAPASDFELKGAGQNPQQPRVATEYFKSLSNQPVEEMKQNDEQYALRWLEDMVLDKLLKDTTPPPDLVLTEELRALLGPGFEENVREIGVTLDQQQLHNLVTDIIRDLVTTQLHHNITKEEEAEEQESSQKRTGLDYTDSFTSSSHRSCSLSLLKTPSLTSRSVSLQSLQFIPDNLPIQALDTPVMSSEEEPCSPSPIKHDRNLRHPVAPAPLSRPVAPPSSHSPPQYLLNESDFNETSHISELNTPSLTSVTLQDTSSHDSTFGVLGPAATPSITELMTDLQNIVIEPLSEESIPEQSTIGDPRSEPSDLSWEDPVISNLTISESTTTDLPISAGEILSGVPREIRALNDVTGALGQLSEGEWPLSPDSLNVIEFIDDPDIRELFREQINAHAELSGEPRPVKDTPPNPRVGHPNAASTFTESPQATRPPKPKKIVVQPMRPSESPIMTSVADLDTFEQITPLPPSTESSETQSPSPPPFMGLDYQDYISKESPSPRKEGHDSSF